MTVDVAERFLRRPLPEGVNDTDGVAEVRSSVIAEDWLFALRRYASVTLGANLFWEFAHAPLYTLWEDEPTGAIVLAVLHCTAGDFVIGGIALFAALLVAGNGNWPRRRFAAVAVLTILFGLAYTLYSEWSNVYVRRTWAYTEAMPEIFGIGLTPILQWLIVPMLAFLAVRRRGAYSGIAAPTARSRTRPF